MARRAKRGVLALHRKIAKDAQKTIQANTPGGRYYVPTLADRMREVRSKLQGPV